MTTEQKIYPLTAVVATVVAALLLVYAYVFGSWFIFAMGAIELAIGIFFGVKWVKLKIEEDIN